MRRLTEHDASQIDYILSREDEILPSSGFAISVMDAVRREAAAPPPIAFPWKRALPGMVVAALALLLVVAGGVMAIAQGYRPATPQLSMTVPFVMPSIFNGGLESAAIWIALALLVAFVSVKLSMRLASGRA
jgi:hypothetical protein